MSSNFQKKTTNVFLTLFIGFIVISFMFTGYETMKGAPDTVALVGDQKISFREYQSEFNRQIEFYSQFVLGGQTLSTKQIQDFNIKQNALKSLVNNRLSSSLGKTIGVVVPGEEIRQSIKQQEFFQTSGKFDIEKYKAILRANQLSPTDYENNVERELVASKTNALLGSYPVSKKFLEDIQGFKEQKKEATIVRLSKDDIGSLLEVSKSEINAYLSDATNQERVHSIFNERKASLDQPETIQASHILVRAKDKETDADLQKRIKAIAATTTAKNFKEMAKKHTDEPAGKQSGGSLGTFGRGRMVPAFEEVAFSLPVGKVSKPVKTEFGYHLILVEKKNAAKEATYDDHKIEIASELLRKQKNDEVSKLVSDVANQVQSALEAGKTSTLKSLQKKWKLNLETDIEINRYDGAKGQVFLETSQLNKVFSHSGSAIDRFESAAYITFVKAEDSNKKNDKKVDLEQDLKSTRLSYSNKMRQEMITKLGDDISVRVYDNRIP